MTGIYKIVNTVNNKVYIGQSTNIESRWCRHIHDLQNNTHANKHLQNAWNKYGADAFYFAIIEECSNDKLTEREQYYIDLYGGLNSSKNYNNRDAGDKGHLSEDTKQKLSNTLKGNVPWNKGLTTGDPRVAKYVEKLRGNTLSDEQKRQISETVKTHHDNGDYDYDAINKKRLATMAENTKNGKIRKVRKDLGTKRDPEIGKRISEAKKRNNARRRELNEQTIIGNQI